MPDEFLSSEEQDIANRLAAYHRKIVSLRAPVIASDAAEGLETPRADKNRRRVSQQRSAAEDYRHARSVQRLLQGVCTAQIVLTLTLAVIARQAVLLAFLPSVDRPSSPMRRSSRAQQPTRTTWASQRFRICF